MTQFDDVLNGVQLALTRASAADIQTLLEALVEEQIISEAYSKSFSLKWLTEEVTLKPGPDLMASWHLSQMGKGESVRPVDEHALHQHQVIHEQELFQELMGGQVMDDPYLNHSLYSTMASDYQWSLGLGDEVTEVQRNAEKIQKLQRDNETINEGKLEDEKEWLEQVEEAARRIAVPLWQHWDRGRRMLLPLVPSMTPGCDHSEARCFLDMKEAELAIACSTLESRTDDITDPDFTLDAPKGFCFFPGDTLATTGLDLFTSCDAGSNVSPVQATNNITQEGDQDVCWAADRTAEDLLCLMGDVQCGTDSGFSEDVAHLFSPCIPADTHSEAQYHSFYSHTDQSMTLGLLDNLDNVFRTAYSPKSGSVDDDFQSTEDEERLDSHWEGAKMQEVDQDPFMCPFLGDLPDDLSEFLNEDCLRKFLVPYLDEDALFDDPLLNCEDELSTCSELPPPAELPPLDNHQPGPKDKTTEESNNRRKRPRASWSRRYGDENRPSRPKRPRTAGPPKTKAAQPEPPVTPDKDVVSSTGTDTEPERSPADTPDVSATPPKILHLHPSIQFITIPDSPAYQVVHTVRLSGSHPVIRLPLPKTADGPTYILVPASSPVKCQGPPLSPMDGAVAPFQTSSSPRGSLSDTASKVLSPPCTSPVSPSNEIPTCKESPPPPPLRPPHPPPVLPSPPPPPPQSPVVLELPEVVKNYIQEAKAHIIQTCKDIEPGLSLTSHYVDVPVNKRELLRSGKNTNKVLEKELIITGDTDRQKSLLEQSQIFSSTEDKPKSYILLLGNAGMGKTTLIRKLCLDWSKNCIPQFDFVFFLDGNALSLTEATYSLQTLLLNLSSFAPFCTDPEAVYAQILAAPKRVLVIFDGFGHLRDYEILLQPQEKDLITSLQRDRKAQTHTVRQLYSAILQRILLPGCTLLLSTRPKGTACQLLRRADRLLEMCGFTPANVEKYLSQYFSDPDLRAAALNRLKDFSYLQLLCWNPGLCRLVCLVLEHCQIPEVLPRTLTGLCHKVVHLKLEKDCRGTCSQAKAPSEISEQTIEETQTQISGSSRGTRKSRACAQRFKKRQQEEDDGKRMRVELLSQLGYLAWEGVKVNSSMLPSGQSVSAKLKAFGCRTGLFCSYHLRTRKIVFNGEEGRGREGRDDGSDDHLLLWTNPFLQSYLAGLHLSLSRTVRDRAFLQTLPFQSGQKRQPFRRRPHREELELTQRFAVGLLYHNRTELQRLHSYTETSFRGMVAAKQAVVTKHLESLSHGDLSSAQVLEACHYVYEASSTHSDCSSDADQLVAHLAINLPEVLTFRGVPLKPSDAFAVQNIVKRAGRNGRRFCLDLEDSGIQISGLRALVGLNNINSYRACIADVITLWEQLEQNGDHVFLQETVSKFKIHPLKVTQVCHVEHLAKLVNIHGHKRLSESSSQSESILAEGVPAVKELHKLEFELGPEKGPLGLSKLWELLPGLPNLQHLDIENSKIEDKGAEELADVFVSLGSLEILNLSQNCIGDQGVKKLAAALRRLPRLHCLSLYSNVISDEGAESLAAVLPHVASLTDLDVKYNKLTDVGAQSLGASLRNCKNMKTLRMWNQCIPFGVFERLQQQDNRINLM